MKLTKVNALKGTVVVPGDKSISHRAVMFGSLAKGKTVISHFLTGADCLSTINCFQKMGIHVSAGLDTNGESLITVEGKGLHGLHEPSSSLDVGNSGTTTRLISGILAGQSFTTHLSGDESIQSRPMKRIISPLTMMGADISSDLGNDCAPLTIRPAKDGKLHGISYVSPVASAQVKSCVLLAGLYADAPTSVAEPALSRNHTELMLSHFGAKLSVLGNNVTIDPEPELIGGEIMVPGDISSAAYFIAAALIVPDSEVLLQNVGINPTRDGILKVAEAMGAKIEYLNQREAGGEPVADLLIRSSSLKATVVEGDIIPTLIDELPVIAVMAAMAEGTTVIRDAAELKVKESDRIAVVTENLKRMGADIEATDDGFIINGGKVLHGALIDSHLDHRIAMSFAVASLVADGETEIKDGECVKISYPKFYSDLARLSK